MTAKQQAYANQAMTIIKGLNKRNMSGYYFETAAKAKEYVNHMIEDGKTVTWGGSMTIKNMGLPSLLHSRDLNVLDRDLVDSPEEVGNLYRQAFSSDYYLMSTNAITLDGQLVNIDGNGNRLAALIYGPDKVIIVAGMNKVTRNVDEGIYRVRNMAAPPNTNRLNINTPCSKTGVCNDCLGQATICCEIVITRKSRHNNRIHVILVGEELGY